MATITIDPNYGYVVVVASASFLLGIAHSVNTGKYRKAAKVTYPNAYAPESRTDAEANKFNCAQRAHANYIENQAQTIPALLIAGVEYPKAAAAMGALWVLSKSVYMLGYNQGGEGKGRYKRGGGAFWLAELGLIGTATWVGAKLALGL